MSKFFLIVSIIYVTYYAANIIYDGFLKKTHVEENNEGDEFVIEGDEQPKKITVEDISYDGSFSENGSVGGREIELSVEETNIINGTIEDQGISVNSFLSEIGKQPIRNRQTTLWRKQTDVRWGQFLTHLLIQTSNK